MVEAICPVEKVMGEAKDEVQYKGLAELQEPTGRRTICEMANPG